MKERYVLLGDANSPHFFKWYKELIKVYDVYVISLNENKSYTYNNYKCFDSKISENGGNYSVLYSFYSIYKQIKTIQPSIVNAHYVTSYGVIAALINCILSYRLIISAWGSDILITPKKNIFYSWATKFALNRSEFITSDSYIMTSEILKLSKGEVITFPMGIDKGIIKSGCDKFNSYTYLSLRSLVPNSNVELIIKAFSTVVKEYNVKLIIANDGPDRNKLEKLVDELGLASSVTFIGYLNGNKLLQLMRKCQTYITIPTSDSLSVSLMEALASEMFIIASDLAANKELLNGSNSIFIKPNEKSLVNAMVASFEKNIPEMNIIYAYNRLLLDNKCLWENNIKLFYNQLNLKR